MMKIGITCYPTIGGSGIIATELGKLLAEKAKYEVHFITSSLPFRLNCVNPEIYFHEVEISHYLVFYHPTFVLDLSAKIAVVIVGDRLGFYILYYSLSIL